MSRKTTIDSLFALRSEAPANSVVGDKDRVRTAAISAMGTSLKELAAGARSAARLQEQIDTGHVVVEIDPGEIDASMVRDRLPAEIDPGFEALVDSLRTSGQQVPVLVRPHPAVAGRYQLAYGHRRVRAAARLGIRIRAVIRTLTDTELVIAQGKENLDRHDLSFIEKAMFARRLEDQGFDRATILAALSTDKADLSRYISVARLVPEPLLAAIGPAGKAGRARWAELAQRLAAGEGEERLESLLASGDFRQLGSDARFARVLAALARPRRVAAVKSRDWVSPQGRKAGRIEAGRERTIVTIDERQAPEFGAFLVGQLDALYRQFVAGKQGEGPKQA